ncbi:MAG: lysoplasmalogenase [Mycobacteriaceae bacterium]|nr:lysoplasmalogenase [Mycobacteriaceae bacterium]
MGTPYARRWVVAAWVAAGWAGMAYGLFLTVMAVMSPPGAELTGRWVAQPAFKALMGALLVVAAVEHPVVRERRWLMPALVFSAVGDWLLAIPWWGPSFVGGLGAFLVAHLCYLGALVPLVGWSGLRAAAVVLVCAGCLGLLVWFWPQLGRDRLTLPVTVYIVVLCAMVCAALMARLPTPWTAVGALCFALSDAMIGIDRFVLSAGAASATSGAGAAGSATSGAEALAVPIWWAYAAAQILITAGFFFGRAEVVGGRG